MQLDPGTHTMFSGLSPVFSLLALRWLHSQEGSLQAEAEIVKRSLSSHPTTLMVLADVHSSMAGGHAQLKCLPCGGLISRLPIRSPNGREDKGGPQVLMLEFTHHPQPVLLYATATDFSFSHSK